MSAAVELTGVRKVFRPQLPIGTGLKHLLLQLHLFHYYTS